MAEEDKTEAAAEVADTAGSVSIPPTPAEKKPDARPSAPGLMNAQKEIDALIPSAEKATPVLDILVPEGADPTTPPTTTAAPEETKAKTGEELRKRYFPKPEELRPEEKKPSGIPSAVSLEDIKLPSYMKGAFSGEGRGSGPAQASSPSQERSIREIGIKPSEAAERKTIVSVANEAKTELDGNGLPRVHTYANDMSEEIERRGATLSTIIGAEREKEAEKKVRVDERKAVGVRRLFLLAAAVLLIVIGVGAIAGVVIFSKKQTATSVETSIIPENKKVVVMTMSEDLPKVLVKERDAADLSLGEVERFVVTDGTQELTPETLLTELGAPSALARNAKRIMIGVHAFDHAQPFIIIETAYYDISFEAMLSWEKTMGESLNTFFAPANAVGLPPELHFTDGIFKNIDVRKSESSWPIIYAFPNRSLLVITTNENTLSEILSRLSIASSR